MNVRKLLGLPEPGETKQKKPKAQPPGAAPGGYGATPGSVWQAAAQQAQPARAESGPAVAWVPVQPSRGGKVWPLVLRGLVIAVAVIVGWVGLRTIFFPPRQETASQQLPASLTFPTTAAGGVASRYVSSFYTWEQGQEAARAKAITLDTAGGTVESGAFGWDGVGKQSAGGAGVVNVSASSATEGRVTVRFTVTPYTGKPGEWKPGTASVRAADVRVQIIDGRVAVVGPPALVAVPEAGEASNTEPDRIEDTELAAATKDYATSFFTAYGKDTDVSALVAPGSTVTGLGAYELESITRWTVFTADGDTRPAIVSLRWRDPATKTLLEQTYSLTLQRVTGGNTERWQVASITGN